MTTNNQPRSLVFNLVSRKGGTGKTTLALRLARYFSVCKHRQVMILDLDFPGAAIVKGLEKALKPLTNKTPRETRSLNEILVRNPLLAVPHDYFQVMKAHDSQGLCLFLGSCVTAKEHNLHKPFLEVEEASHFFLSHYLTAVRNIFDSSSLGDQDHFKLKPGPWVLILDHSPGLAGISRQLLDDGPKMLAGYLGLDPAAFQMYHLLVASSDRHDLADSLREFALAFAGENKPAQVPKDFPYFLAVNRITLPSGTEDETDYIIRALMEGDMLLKLDAVLENALRERMAVFLHEDQYQLFDLCNHTEPFESLDSLPEDSSTWDKLFAKIGAEI